jgi:uncharacterized protein
MSNYHEPVEELDDHTKDISRALVSLKEEVEAIDWYNQRIFASSNEGLKKILEHNRDEEIEHACMAIEWLRKNMPGWDEKLREELFKDEGAGPENPGNLKIGKIK